MLQRTWECRSSIAGGTRSSHMRHMTWTRGDALERLGLRRRPGEGGEVSIEEWELRVPP